MVDTDAFDILSFDEDVFGTSELAKRKIFLERKSDGTMVDNRHSRGLTVFHTRGLVKSHDKPMH